MHFARSVIILAAMINGAAQAEPCRMGSNMPAGDANPAKPISTNQARMVCNEGVLVSRARDGTPQTMRTWKFELKK